MSKEEEQLRNHLIAIQDAQVLSSAERARQHLELSNRKKAEGKNHSTDLRQGAVAVGRALEIINNEAIS